jgi:hypothetical protein
VALVASTFLACTPARRAERPAGAPQPIASARPTVETTAELAADVDHVIVGIDTLARGIELLRQATGLTAVYGGAHPGRGTQNALLSLGRGVYLELMAPNPQDAAGAARAPEFASLRTLTPIGWAVKMRHADSLSAALHSRGLPGGVAQPGARHRPDGTTLRWRTLNPWGLPTGVLPFFIEWDPAGVHPSTDAPAGCTLAGLTLSSPSPDSLRALLARAELRVPVTHAARDALSLTLDCPTGRVYLP